MILRLFDLLWTVLLIAIGFWFFGIVGAFMGAVLGILSGIAAEVRRGNDAKRADEQRATVDGVLDWIDRKTGGKLSGGDRKDG